MSATPGLTDSDTSTPGMTVPATPAEPDLEHPQPSASDPDEPPAAAAICTTDHAMYVFDVLAAHLGGREHVNPPFRNGKDKYALFVTWNTVRAHRKPVLRGCIGNFSPMRLDKGLAEYALVAALEDHRFTPVRASELSSLSASVSLLTPFTPVATPLSWTVGEHGIHITFKHPTTGRNLSATYLPDVAKEQGWDKEEALRSLVNKAGCHTAMRCEPGDPVYDSISLKVYGSVKATATWEEYERWAADRGVVASKAAKAEAKDSTLSVLAKLVRGG